MKTVSAGTRRSGVAQFVLTAYMPGFAVGWADHIQAILRRRAPNWSRQIEAVQEVDDEHGMALDGGATSMSAELQRTLLGAQPTFGTSAANVRLVGERVFRGFTGDFAVLLHADEEPLFSSPRNGVSIANHLLVWVYSATIEGQAASTWIKDLLLEIVTSVTTWYGNARTPGEFAELNKSGAGVYAQVEGIDIAAALPGVYWLNWLGRPWLQMIGKDRLTTVPAFWTQVADAGVAFAIADSPTAWQSSEYRKTREAVIAHIGTQHVYDRRWPGAPTTAPDLVSYVTSHETRRGV